jgi:Cu/Ag efflux protein CusF
MNLRLIPALRLTLILGPWSLVLTPAALSAAEKSPTPAAPTTSAEAPAAPKRHPLRGVITSVLTEKSAFMVKHEEIPGVMRAMTMMFKVDATALKTFKAGDTVTGLMSRQATGWVLEEVKPAAPAAKK